MTMTAEQLAQLREVAERANTPGSLTSYSKATALMEFDALITPDITLALLDELERKGKRIAELEEQLRREQDYHLSVDMERMELWKKLEARTVTVKLPDVERWRSVDAVRAQNAYRVLVIKTLADAGINLTVEG
ncbi:ead/Ea22-like family protein [Atlantibacter hermannii]|uniref:ead/Ea22-like family protein n=1 Tax=Atlantibacter hermannii TaxID=565 RepID=UPI00280228D8|nr:ead/Ea22-like family protein [Atlantibacter hermannii]MDQ7883670.1 hypothetical protein [Atlantibacter hermannii]